MSNNSRVVDLGSGRITKKDHILSIIWLFVLLFPTGTIFYISIPILFLYLYDRKNKANRIFKSLLFLIIPTAIFNIWQPYMDFRSYVRFLSIAIIFLTFASYKGNRILFPYIFFSAFYVLLSQVSLTLNLPYLAPFFDNIYEISEMTKAYQSLELSDVEMEIAAATTRFGGIYINPNNCASFLSVLLAAGLCSENQLNGKKKYLILYSFIGMIIISTLVTGSRTSLIVFSSIILYYLYAKGFGVLKYLVIIFVVLVVLLCMDLEEIRLLKVADGIHDSFGTKVEWFIEYLSKISNPIWWLFGAGDIMVTVSLYDSNMIGVDFDFGNIFIAFGLFFYLLYFVVLFRIYKILRPQYRPIMFVLLWSFSNSILLSYRMCPVFFMTLGLLYRDSLLKNKTEKISRIKSTL